MKNLNKSYLLLITFAALLMFLSFICQYYIQIPDIINGILKGTSIGLLLLGVALLSKQHIERV
ncbi:hypothetical protein WAF17_04210 [Bernardetia sp. ABR2-2B]|uniref:hypothetical protein n=1 Tax=Bernardetia sp. ABR2-2B TaxID=3127472 RepID=UPI0030CDA237